MAFATLGYQNPPKSPGIRILALDGGGVRGLVALQVLKRLEELTSRKSHELFDYICGVSTGAIITCAIGAYQKDLDSLSNYYRVLSSEIFNQNPLIGTGNLVWSHGYYNTELWERTLKTYFGEWMRLVDTTKNAEAPKLAAVSAIVNESLSLSPYVFRNYVLPEIGAHRYNGSCQHFIWQAIRASAAAPTFFHEFKIGNFLHQDGAIMANNPSAIATYEARQLWPDERIQCVVSLGTGKMSKRLVNSAYGENTCLGSSSNNVGVGSSNNNSSNNNDLPNAGERTLSVSSWGNKFTKLLESATDTEEVHLILNDWLPRNCYFRLNPLLSETIAMTETRKDKLDLMQQDVDIYLRLNDDRLRQIAALLIEPRTRLQQLNDWVKLQRKVFDWQ